MTGRMARGLPAASVVLVTLSAACETQVPERPVGGTIQGQIRYMGEGHKKFARPALQLAALALVPPPGRPHGALFIDRPDFSKPIPYLLRNLPPYRYKVVARLIDGDNAMADTSMQPTGSYPDFCTLTSAGEGPVVVTDTAPTTGIDITLYDDGGAGDPCNRSADDVCPKPGSGTLHVTLDLMRDKEMIKAPDQLVFVILRSPSEFPTRFKLLPAQELASGFPYTIIINDVPPDSYLIYSCYDVGGNNLMKCGPEDFAHFYMDMTKTAVDAGKITSVRMDLAAKTSAPTTVEEPSARGCK